MFTTTKSQTENLHDIAACHMACFPTSLATRLGKAYVKKTLEWFLVDVNRFLFHVYEGGKIVGYCGGFVPIKPGDGSSSGMLQYAFKQAIRGILLNPFLLFHPEVSQNYSFLWMNIKRKLTGKVKPFKPVANKPFKQYAGLVVIGVHPAYRGKGIARQLMIEFELQAKQFNQHEMVLSVKKDNSPAINAYKKFGWNLREEHEKTLVMCKGLSEDAGLLDEHSFVSAQH